MARTIHGRVHGETIELDEDPGVAEGQEVEVQAISRSPRQPGERFLHTEGALADDTEWDAIMEEIHRDRKQNRRPWTPNPGDARTPPRPRTQAPPARGGPRRSLAG